MTLLKKAHHSAKPIDINGIHYATRHEAANALGLSESGLSKQLKRNGLNKIDRPANTLTNNIYPVMIDNQQFYSNAELAKYLNVSNGTIGRKLRMLIDRNLPITKENLLTIEKYRMTEVIHGKVYHHWKDISNDYQIGLPMLHKRQSQGFRGNNLVKPVKHRRKNQPVTISGVQYENLRHAADRLHIPYQNLYYRYQKYQNGEMTEAELLQTKHIGTRRYHVTINGKAYSKLKDVANDYPVSYHQIKLWHRMLRQDIITHEQFENWVINGHKS